VKNIIVALLFVAMLSIVGCGTWSTVGGVYKDSHLNISTELPLEWKRLKSTKDGRLTITRDGLSLQEIRIARFALGKDLPNTKKKITQGMLPQEAAEILIDDLNSDFELANKNILENTPETIDGFSGFKISYSFETIKGLKKKAIAFGFLTSKWVYLISYNAPSRYYFDKDFPSFEKVRGSFTLIDKDV
jgi:hypothetical protein